MPAQQETLGDLHEQLAQTLLAAVRGGAATAAILNVARQFLKDNNIDADAKRGSPLKALEETLGDFDEDDPDNVVQFGLFYQMTRLTRIKRSLLHDDRLDALSWAVWYWLQHMAGDQEARIQATHERWLQQQIDDFLSHSLGSQPAPLTWM